MIRKAYWSGLASIIVALAVVTGCSTNVATAPPTQTITIAAGTCTAVNTCTGPFQQNAVVNPVQNPPTPPGPSVFLSPLSATVMSNGTPVVGAVVTFTGPLGGAGGGFGSIGGPNFTTATTNASGVATTSQSFYPNATVGTYSVIAATDSTQSTAVFSMANTLQPEPVSVSGGSLQSTSMGTQFANSLSVTVTDGKTPANPVGAQLPVTFTVVPDPVTGASGTFADSGTQNTPAVNTTTVLTNASGVATAPPFSANSTVGGPYTVLVTIPEDNDSATATVVNLYNTIVPATITPVAGSTPQNATSGTNFANNLTVTVVDATTPVPNPVVGAVVTFTAPSFTYNTAVPPVASTSSGYFFDTATMAYDLLSVQVVTDSTGTATPPAPPLGTNFQANTLPGGPYNVTASVVVKSGTTLSTNSETPTQNFVLTND